MRLFQQGMALFLSWCLLLIGIRDGLAYQTATPNSQPAPQAARILARTHRRWRPE
jgi:hypothetical protein